MDDEYSDMDEGLEFWEIEIAYGKYPSARGVLYEKPTPYTVKARVSFPRLEPAPGLQVGERTKITARCANRRWMRGILADVKAVSRQADGGQIVELLLYRKQREQA